MYKGLIGVDRRTLDQRESETFMSMAVADMQVGNEEALDEIHQGLLKKSPAYAIMTDRLTAVGSIEFISRPLMFFLATTIDRPGTAVLWAYTLNWMATQNERVRTEEWSLEFPDGLPTEDGMQAAWDAQKGVSLAKEDGQKRRDNWIDDPANWPRREEREGKKPGA